MRLPKARFLEKGSVANVQGIASLPTIRLGRRLGMLPVGSMAAIKKAITWALELENRSTIEPAGSTGELG